MKQPQYTQMFVQLANGNTQVIKPNMNYFDGNWKALAESIYGVKEHNNYKVIFKLS